jgi:hypothetical protein
MSKQSETDTVTTAPEPIAQPHRRIRRFIRPIVVLAAIVSAVVTMTAVLSTPASAAARKVIVYRVTIRGTASGNPFAVRGVLLLAPTVTRVTTNGVNPFEACLASGFPAGNPQTGAIRYGTNSACFRSRGANIDTVFARLRGRTYRTRPDGRLQATFLNNWTARPGITACIYSPVSGSTVYRLRNKRVRGAIHMRGYGGAFCGFSTYDARIRGRRIR